MKRGKAKKIYTSARDLLSYAITIRDKPQAGTIIISPSSSIPLHLRTLVALPTPLGTLLLLVSLYYISYSYTRLIVYALIRRLLDIEYPRYYII